MPACVMAVGRRKNGTSIGLGVRILLLGAAIGLPPSFASAQTTQRVHVPATNAIRASTGETDRDRRAEAQVERSIPMYVGESRLIDAPWPVKRVSVNNPAVADVDVISPQQVQLQGIGPGITDLTLWSEDDRIWRARVEVELDLRKLQGQLNKLFPAANLQLSQVGEVIAVSGSFARAEEAMHLRSFLTSSKLNYLDMTSIAGLQQVQLRVRVAEVSRNALRSLNVNAFWDQGRFFGGNQLGGSGGPFTPMSGGIPDGSTLGAGRLPFQVTEGNISVPPTAQLFAGFPNSDLEIFINALAENQYLRTLAEPTLIAASGESATFLAGGEVPIPVSDVQGGNTQISIEYREYGIRLAFKPFVLGGGTIRLSVTPEVSELTDVGAITVLGSRIPALRTRRVNSTFEMQSGQTFAIAGLIERSTNAQNSRIPGLGDLPVLGAMFRSVRYQTSETELMVLVTASLVEPQSVRMEDVPYPGMMHKKPGPWRFYVEGQLEAKHPRTLTPAQQDRLSNLGLNKLNGPGAWASYETVDQSGDDGAK